MFLFQMRHRAFGGFSVLSEMWTASNGSLHSSSPLTRPGTETQFSVQANTAVPTPRAHHTCDFLLRRGHDSPTEKETYHYQH
jgi:hypothetical protein